MMATEITPSNFEEKLLSLITTFVTRSGGRRKVLAAARALRGVGVRAIPGFVREVSSNEEVARQLVAAAVLGFTLAAALSRPPASAESVN